MGFIINTTALSAQRRSPLQICKQGKSSTCLCLRAIQKLENVSELVVPYLRQGEKTFGKKVEEKEQENKTWFM